MLRKQTFWESLIVVIILLSIIEIFVEDISVIGNWSVLFRRQLLIIGFLFDLIFTIEFAVRSKLSRKNKGWVFYWKHEKGWVDFLSSIPLILFCSGPIMLGMFLPGRIVALPFLGLLNILKITKILRVARMLRLLRILKMLNKVKVEESELKIKQVSLMTSITVLTITIILIVSPLFPGLFYSQDVNVDKQKQKYVSVMQEWHRSLSPFDTERIQKLQFLLEEDKNVLFMYHIGNALINNLGEEGVSPAQIIPDRFLYTDFKVLNYLNFKLWYSVKEVLIDNAKINLLIEVIIIALLVAFVLFYKPIIE